MSGFTVLVDRFSVLKHGLAVLAIGLVVTCFWAGSASGQPFYEGKTLRILVPYGPGGTSDIFSRLLARFMGRYIPGNPTIIVQNMPGGGGMIAMNYLYAVAKPDGLTIGHTAVPGARDQLLGSPWVKHDYAKFEHLGSGGPSFQIFAIRASIPYKALENLRTAKEPLFVAAESPGATSSVVARILAREGFRVKEVTGYSGSAAREVAVIKKEVDATVFTELGLIRNRESLTPLFWIASKGASEPDLPTMEELLPGTRPFIKPVTVPLSQARAYLAPPGTPKERVSMLSRAIEQTVKSSRFLEEAERAQVEVRWVSPEETLALSLAMLKTPPQGVAALKEIMGLSK